MIAFSKPLHPTAEGVPAASVTAPPSHAGGLHVSPWMLTALMVDEKHPVPVIPAAGWPATNVSGSSGALCETPVTSKAKSPNPDKLAAVPSNETRINPDNASATTSVKFASCTSVV